MDITYSSESAPPTPEEKPADEPGDQVDELTVDEWTSSDEDSPTYKPKTHPMLRKDGDAPMRLSKEDADIYIQGIQAAPLASITNASMKKTKKGVHGPHSVS